MPKVRKIKSFDRAECRRFSEAVEIELQKLAKQYGLSIKRGNARFTPTNTTLKIEASIVNPDGTVHTKDAETFKMYARMYELEPTDLGREFTDWSGKTFTITGASSRRCRTPIFVERADGKRFRMPCKEVKALLERR